MYQRRKKPLLFSTAATGRDWPNSARFNAVAGRLTQDHAGPFCTMKARPARDLCDNWSQHLRSPPRRGVLGTLE